jgi:small subunit ribosomal protein S20
MPNTAAAKKAIRSDARKRVFNLRRKRVMTDVLKQIRDLVGAGKIKEAVKLVPEAYQAIDKAAKRGVIKSNTADRKKSRLSQFLKKSS